MVYGWYTVPALKSLFHIFSCLTPGLLERFGMKLIWMKTFFVEDWFQWKRFHIVEPFMDLNSNIEIWNLFQWNRVHNWTLPELEIQTDMKFYFNEIGFRIQHPVDLKPKYIWILFQWNWFQNSTPHGLEIRFIYLSIGLQVHGVLNSETSFIEIYFISIHRISKVSQLNTPACRPWVWNLTNMISTKKVSQFSNTPSWLLIFQQTPLNLTPH